MIISLPVCYNGDKLLVNKRQESLGRPMTPVLFHVKDIDDVVFILAHGSADGHIMSKSGQLIKPAKLVPSLLKRGIASACLVCCHPEAFPKMELEGVTFTHIAHEIPALPQAGRLHIDVVDTIDGIFLDIVAK